MNSHLGVCDWPDLHGSYESPLLAKIHEPARHRNVPGQETPIRKREFGFMLSYFPRQKPQAMAGSFDEFAIHQRGQLRVACVHDLRRRSIFHDQVDRVAVLAIDCLAQIDQVLILHRYPPQHVQVVIEEYAGIGRNPGLMLLNHPFCKLENLRVAPGNISGLLAFRRRLLPLHRQQNRNDLSRRHVLFDGRPIPGQRVFLFLAADLVFDQQAPIAAPTPRENIDILPLAKDLHIGEIHQFNLSGRKRNTDFLVLHEKSGKKPAQKQIAQAVAFAPHTEADPAALLLDLLISFGNVIGRNSYFVADGAEHYPNLFAVLVGNSSKGRKGTSRAHIARLFASFEDGWASERVQAGLSSGEGLIWAVRDPIIKREPVKEKGRFTGEYDEIEADSGVKDKRLLVTEGEFANVLRVLGREGNNLSAIIRQAWDTGSLRTLTKNSPAKASGAHISILGHITRDELRRFLSSTEAGNGFGNRFLWLCVRRSKCLPEGGRIHEVDLGEPLRHLQEAMTFGSVRRRVERDDDARAIWLEVYPDLSEGKPGLFGSVTSRAEAQVMRLAMIYALLDCSPVIRSEHLMDALALWEYCEQSARYIFGDALGDPIADELLRALRNAGSAGMTRTEIRDLFKRHRGAEQIGRVLSLLLEYGYVRREQEKTSGRPVERWSIATCDAT